MHRTILALDVEGSTAGTNATRYEIRTRMYEIVAEAMQQAGIVVEDILDRGDGVIVLLREVPKPLVLNTVMPSVAELLVGQRFRLRVAVHAGEVEGDPHGYFGEAVDLTCRLLDAPRAKRALRQSALTFVLVVSDEFYRSVVCQGYDGIDPSTFAPLRVRLGNRSHRGWIQLAGRSAPMSEKAAVPRATPLRPRNTRQTDRAHSARIYDYILGGKDNYAVDRAVGDASMQAWPALRTHMLANRSFMHRVGRFLAARHGITQFLDIGTGIPTEPNLHQIVQRVRPDSRIIYTDNDPIVLAHARALMTSTPEGRIAYIHADMRDADAILGSPQLREVLDMDRPVGLLILAMLHFIEDDDEAYRVVRQMLDALSAGSYLAASIATDDFDPVPLAKVQLQYRAHGETLQFRTKDQAARFFDGLELEEPGVVQIHKWHPDPDADIIADTSIAMYGAIARKP
jgi:hypothetical protein